MGDIEKPSSNALLNTRMSGEYVKINNQEYRIVNIDDDGNVKLTLNDVIRDTNSVEVKKKLASYVPFGSSKKSRVFHAFGVVNSLVLPRSFRGILHILPLGEECVKFSRTMFLTTFRTPMRIVAQRKRKAQKPT